MERENEQLLTCGTALSHRDKIRLSLDICDCLSHLASWDRNGRGSDHGRWHSNGDDFGSCRLREHRCYSGDGWLQHSGSYKSFSLSQGLSNELSLDNGGSFLNGGHKASDHDWDQYSPGDFGSGDNPWGGDRGG